MEKNGIRTLHPECNYRRPGNPHTNRSLDALTFARSMLYKTYCGRPSQSDDWEIAKTTQYKPKHPNRG